MLPPPPARPYRIFISYSHAKEVVKERLETSLKPLERLGLARLWQDRVIPAGADWRQEIDDAMAAADVAVFVLDQAFLASPFCMDVEVDGFLAEQRRRGTLIFFVVAEDCAWQWFDFIARYQLLPRDGRPITKFNPHSTAYASIADEIKGALVGHHAKEDLGDGRTVPSDSTAASMSMAAAEKPVPPPFTLQSLIDRLPGRTARLFGREQELALLDEWCQTAGVTVLVAAGGCGKSALLRHWLARADWPAGMRFIGRSFGRGAADAEAEARDFLLDSLRQLAVAHDGNDPDAALGLLLARALASQSTLLVLDGIETLQLGADGEPGCLRNKGLLALIAELARRPGQSLCLVSSRRPIADADVRQAPKVHGLTLSGLPPTAALALLRHRGMNGDDRHLAMVATRCDCQPLALVLAAEFAHTYLDGDAEALAGRDWMPPSAGSRTSAVVMDWLDQALAEENQVADRELMRILGLFEQRIPWAALIALHAAPPIAGLTDRLHALDETEIAASVARLIQWGLLQGDLAGAEPEFECHALVGEHFARRLATELPDARQLAHGVLFDWYRRQPDDYLPETLAELQPLYRAAHHGCLAGRHREALYDVAVARIWRDRQGYSWRHFGSYALDLCLIGDFFAEPWRHPVANLPDNAQAWLLSAAAFCLRALGRLQEAIEPMRASAEAMAAHQDAVNAAIAYGNLAEFQLGLGQIGAAIASAELAVAHADRGSDAFQPISARATLADARHQAGDDAAAAAGFAEAEAMQARDWPDSPLLHSLRGYLYCDLLLERPEQAAWRDERDAALAAACDRVAERARQTLARASAAGSPLDVALDQLTLGRCALCGDILRGAAVHEAARDWIEAAVARLRDAGERDMLALGLLTRAWLYYRSDDDAAAAADLAEAEQIAEAGDMRLRLADIALARHRLFGDREALERARRIVAECGYGRRAADLPAATAATG